MSSRARSCHHAACRRTKIEPEAARDATGARRCSGPASRQFVFGLIVSMVLENKRPMDDRALLDRYARHHDEDAFKELVRRHVSFVHAAALRQVGGDAHAADDVTQSVFTDLARKARRLTGHPVLKGWLFTSTRYAAAKFVRREQLRRSRETKAFTLQITEAASARSWDEIRPEFDAVLAALREKDRTALLLRFFESNSYAQIGVRLNVSEDAARMRVERALNQLRDRLARRGITSSSAALASLLTSQATIAAPAGLAQSVASTALAASAARGSAIGVLRFLSSSPTHAGVAAFATLAGLLTLPPIGVAVHQTRSAQKAELEAHTAQREHEAMIARLRALQERRSETAERSAEVEQALAQALDALAQSRRFSRLGGASAGDPHADGVRFLASYPKARALLIASGKARTPPKLLDIFRRAGLAEAQIDALNTRLWANRTDRLTLTPSAVGWNISGYPPDEEMRLVLGESGYREFERYRAREPVYDAAAQIAAAVGYTAAPLNAGQIDQLVEGMWVMKPTATLRPGTPEWDTATAAMRTAMTPEQWQVAEGAIASVIFPRVLAFLQRQPAATGTPPPR